MAAFEAGHGAGPGGYGEDVDLDDLFASMFMGGMGGMPGMGGHGHPGHGHRHPGAGGRRKQRGKDVVQAYECSLEDLYKGKTVKLSSVRNKLCGGCSGYDHPFPRDCVYMC